MEAVAKLKCRGGSLQEWSEIRNFAGWLKLAGSAEKKPNVEKTRLAATQSGCLWLAPDGPGICCDDRIPPDDAVRLACVDLWFPTFRLAPRQRNRRADRYRPSRRTRPCAHGGRRESRPRA